jgi:hypothetical protein
MGGGSLTDAAQTETADNIRTWSQSKDSVSGAMFELRFRSRFSVEVDAMYRELHATIASVEPNRLLYGVCTSGLKPLSFQYWRSAGSATES